MYSHTTQRSNDPLNPGAIDRELRIDKLRRELDEMTGGAMIRGKSPDCSSALEESFLEHVLAMERHGFVCPHDILVGEGFEFPAVEALDDPALEKKLRELIDALATRRLFLEQTDHLSDRELYIWLCEQLREEMMGFGLPFGNCHLDVLGSCGEEDIVLQMRYYSDEEERKRWADTFPDFPVPPREKPPYDRDRHLPKPTC